MAKGSKRLIQINRSEVSPFSLISALASLVQASLLLYCLTLLQQNGALYFSNACVGCVRAHVYFYFVVFVTLESCAIESIKHCTILTELFHTQKVLPFHDVTDSSRQLSLSTDHINKTLNKSHVNYETCVYFIWNAYRYFSILVSVKSPVRV